MSEVKRVDECPYEFAEEPTLPLKRWGSYQTTGWDISTRWAIDANNQCWMDNAHGHSLYRVDSENLIGDLNSNGHESLANDVRLCLGLAKVQTTGDKLYAYEKGKELVREMFAAAEVVDSARHQAALVKLKEWSQVK